MYITKATVTRLANYAASSVEHVRIEIETLSKNCFDICFCINDYICVDIDVYSSKSNVYADPEPYDPECRNIRKCKNFKELKEFFEEVKNTIESLSAR